jgi:hypothetical protein
MISRVNMPWLMFLLPRPHEYQELKCRAIVIGGDLKRDQYRSAYWGDTRDNASRESHPYHPPLLPSNAVPPLQHRKTIKVKKLISLYLCFRRQDIKSLPMQKKTPESLVLISSVSQAIRFVPAELARGHSSDEAEEP